MATPESRVKDKVKDILAEYSDLYYEMPVPGGYGKSGLDFIGCYFGRFFSIETKAEGKEPTPLQEKCMRNMVKAGGVAFVVTGGDPKSYEVLKMWLDITRRYEGKC